jgi:hypothetical protein
MASGLILFSYVVVHLVNHMCIGLRFWLRPRPWYARAQPWLYAVFCHQ